MNNTQRNNRNQVFEPDKSTSKSDATSSDKSDEISRLLELNALDINNTNSDNYEMVISDDDESKESREQSIPNVFETDSTESSDNNSKENRTENIENQEILENDIDEERKLNDISSIQIPQKTDFNIKDQKIENNNLKINLKSFPDDNLKGYEAKDKFYWQRDFQTKVFENNSTGSADSNSKELENHFRDKKIYNNAVNYLNNNEIVQPSKLNMFETTAPNDNFNDTKNKNNSGNQKIAEKDVVNSNNITKTLPIPKRPSPTVDKFPTPGTMDVVKNSKFYRTNILYIESSPKISFENFFEEPFFSKNEKDPVSNPFSKTIEMNEQQINDGEISTGTNVKSFKKPNLNSNFWDFLTNKSSKKLEQRIGQNLTKNESFLDDNSKKYKTKNEIYVEKQQLLENNTVVLITREDAVLLKEIENHEDQKILENSVIIGKNSNNNANVASIRNNKIGDDVTNYLNDNETIQSSKLTMFETTAPKDKLNNTKDETNSRNQKIAEKDVVNSDNITNFPIVSNYNLKINQQTPPPIPKRPLSTVGKIPIPGTTDVVKIQSSIKPIDFENSNSDLNLTISPKKSFEHLFKTPFYPNNENDPVSKHFPETIKTNKQINVNESHSLQEKTAENSNSDSNFDLKGFISLPDRRFAKRSF
ncbi:3143_t:CDS:2 [Acaulospora morrowiae]|uniref:3143_t:CDS:1 n=1 Tax=Acaulospora morrowiae TaxID=94023 RepID=A0A9N8W4V0_9GLOM|nr:3143_t:CDS:2 [Acaulospora morrowiae]